MTTSAGSWRYRLERASLRFQARLDTSGVDSVFPWAAALLVFGVLAGLASARAYMLRAGADLALFKQSVWHVSRGFRPESTLLGGDYLAESGAYVIYPISLLVRWLPITPHSPAASVGGAGSWHGSYLASCPQTGRTQGRSGHRRDLRLRRVRRCPQRQPVRLPP